MKNKIVVGLGELLWDIFPDKTVIGGAPANFAYNIGQLGYESYIVSGAGEDNLGVQTLLALNDKSQNYILDMVNYPTGTVSVELDREGVPTYIIHEDVAWDNMSFTDQMRSLAKKTDAVCFGTLAQRSNVSRATIQEFIQAMPNDSLKVFDINLRQHYYNKEIIEQSLEMASALKLNEDEILVIADLYSQAGEKEEFVCQSLMERYDFQFLILTKGAFGSYVYTKDNISFLPTPKVDVVDTVGAGDAFTAAFVASFLAGKSVQDSHQLAVEVSAFVCSQSGGMNMLPAHYKNKL